MWRNESALLLAFVEFRCSFVRGEGGGCATLDYLKSYEEDEYGIHRARNNFFMLSFLSKIAQ